MYMMPFCNLDGNPVERTPVQYPYNYDDYVIWMDNDLERGKDYVVWSDRLHQWDHEQYDKCCQEVFGNTGQYFGNREPKEIEKFLSVYFEREIKLTAITQCCNQASGFPYWGFFYKYVDMLPCPFCGREAVVTEVSFEDGDVWYHPECLECDCGWQANYPTVKEAIAAWNNRRV